MKYKAIALDLDGTLTNTDKKILPKTKKIVRELARQGVTIILASGRPTPGMYAEAKELGLDIYGGYLLSFNGAKVIECKDKEIIYEKVFSSALAAQVYDQAKKYDLAVMTYVDQDILSEDVEDRYVIIEGAINRMPIQKVVNFKKAIRQDVNKVLLTGEPEYVAKILKDFQGRFGSTLSIYRSAPFFIEVMAPGIDKAYALERVLHTIGIHRQELISFGDGYNDVSMVEFAGFGVAMGNAVEEVKQKANYITNSNDEEGIASCLKMIQRKGEI